MRHGFSRLAIFSACVVALVAQTSITPPARAQGDVKGANADSATNRISISPVVVFGGTTVITGAGSELVRAKGGVYMDLHTQGLTPGIVATAWWVFFNNPAACATDPCSGDDFPNPAVEASVLYAAGRVVGPDGALDIGAFRAAGDTTGANFGPGLLDPKRAQIHLVVRSHGPALLGDPAALAAQLTTFNGGCPPNACGNVQASVHEP